MTPKSFLEHLSPEGLVVIRSKVFEDFRGTFTETWSRAAFADLGIAMEFVQQNQSYSKARYTLRGLHFQRAPFEQAKLIGVLAGKILDVTVDLRRSSRTFLETCSITLEAGDARQLLVPRGFAHGYMTLTADTVISYLVDAPYAPQHEGGIRWNDAALKIAWPVDEDEITMSPRDRNLPDLATALTS
jgi:dTDP-4-dehydrorhamnose 3,5-epimerase